MLKERLNTAMRYDPNFYSSKAWRAFRARFLRMHPVCHVPGCGHPAEHVDHVKSRAEGGAPLDAGNAKGCCWSHHSQKTAACDGGFGNRKGDWQPTVKGSDASGWPAEPNHPWNRDGADV